MFPIYKGLPELFNLIIYLVERRSKRDSLTIVAFHLLSEILKNTEHAMVHYFTLTLEEPFLQNSQHGSPYQKWALITNQNFRQVDQNVNSLGLVYDNLCSDTFDNMTGTSAVGEVKIAYVWFSRLVEQFKCCVINKNKPLLSLSEIGFEGWMDPVDDHYIFKNLHISDSSPVKKTKWDISDRQVLKDMQCEGSAKVEELRTLLTCFATWLEEKYSMSDIVKVPERRITWNLRGRNAI